MNEHALEQVIVDFWEKEFDVLVSTTIVESGIDIPNANTLIVDRADNFGLSQLHQLRGRVGRGRERGYAYFLYPPEKPLTETAHERLATIAQHTELGAGHGRGDEGPGDPRRGQPARRRAVRAHRRRRLRPVRPAWSARPSRTTARLERRRAEEEPPLEVKVELPVDAHVPHEYVPGERLRLEAYRGHRRRRTPRRTSPPSARSSPTGTASCPSRWRTCCWSRGCGCWPGPCGVTEIVLQGNNIRFAPVELRESQELRLKRLYPRQRHQAATPPGAGAAPEDGQDRRQAAGRARTARPGWGSS